MSHSAIRSTVKQALGGKDLNLRLLSATRRQTGGFGGHPSYVVSAVVACKPSTYVLQTVSDFYNEVLASLTAQFPGSTLHLDIFDDTRTKL